MNFKDYKVDIPAGKRGEWEILKIKISNHEAHAFNLKKVINGRPERSILPGTYTQLRRSGGIVMTDTPAEIIDLQEIISRAKGKILINGLGLGVVLNPILANHLVTNVVVIEISQDLIDLVGRYYLQKYSPRLKIIYSDALTYSLHKNDRYNLVWHDIWDTISIDNYSEMKLLHKKYGKRCDWQESWCRSFVKKMIREEKKYGSMGATRKHWRNSEKRIEKLLGIDFSEVKKELAILNSTG